MSDIHSDFPKWDWDDSVDPVKEVLAIMLLNALGPLFALARSKKAPEHLRLQASGLLSAIALYVAQHAGGGA